MFSVSVTVELALYLENFIVLWSDASFRLPIDCRTSVVTACFWASPRYVCSVDQKSFFFLATFVFSQLFLFFFFLISTIKPDKWVLANSSRPPDSTPWNDGALLSFYARRISVMRRRLLCSAGARRCSSYHLQEVTFLPLQQESAFITLINSGVERHAPALQRKNRDIALH